MKRLFFLILLAAAAFGQTTNYPGSFDTDASLYVTADNQQSYLTVAMGTGDSVAVVASGAGFAVNQIATVCDTQQNGGPMNGKCTAWEHMKITAVNGNQLTVTRGVNGTSARAHAANRPVSVPITSGHQKVAKDAIIAIETAIGLNPVSSGASAAVSVPTATGAPAVLGGFVDGSAASPQSSDAKSSIIFQRVNALPANIATAFTFDCSSTAASRYGFSGGCITTNTVIHDQTIARGGAASRVTAYADAPAASAALVTASLATGTVTVTTGSAHYVHAGETVIIAGSSGMTGLNGTFIAATVPDSTHLTFACGGCSGGPGSGGTASAPAPYYASWISAWKVAGPNIRIVGEESDMNNQYGDAGDSTSVQDATFNYAVYCSYNNCTTGMYIDSGDGTGKYYHPLKFGPNAVVAAYPYIDSSAGPNNVDFAWIGNSQFLRWVDTGGNRWPIIGLDTFNNFRISAPTGQIINMGPNLAQVLYVGATKVSNQQATVLAKTPNYIASETGANNAIAGALTDAVGTAVPLAAGLRVTVQLAHTLQAGANTFNLNGGGALGIKSGRNVANDIGVAYAATGTITLQYDGTRWVDVAQ